MMDSKKRKRLGLSLKTTKKTIADRNKLNSGQGQDQYFKQNFGLIRDTHKSLQKLPKQLHNNDVIVVDDDPLETVELRKRSNKINHWSASETMKETWLGEDREQTKTHSCLEAGASQDFYDGFERRRGFYMKKLISKDTDWKSLDDLPCQSPFCQSKSNLSESDNVGSPNRIEIMQRTRTSGGKINSLPQDKGETLYRNVDFIYSFYSDLPKPCMVCSTRKPLCVNPLENPITVSEEHESRRSNESSESDGFYRQSKLTLSSNKSNDLISFDEAKLETEDRKSEWDETEQILRIVESGVKFPGGVQTDEYDTAQGVNKPRPVTNEKHCLVNNKVELNSSTCLDIPCGSESNLRCYTKSYHSTDKSYLSSNGRSAEKRTTVMQNRRPSKNNSESKANGRFAGFRTSRSTEPLVENRHFEETHKISNRNNVNDRNTEMLSSASAERKSTLTFVTRTDTSLTDALNDRAAFQSSFQVDTKSQCDTSRDLRSCPMCLQEFPTWSSDQVEYHISKCPGLEDIICDDNDVEW